jgi:hypothetical protein
MFGGVYVLGVSSSRWDYSVEWAMENKYAFRRISGYPLL